MWQEMAQYKTNPEKHLSPSGLAQNRNVFRTISETMRKKSPSDEIPRNSTQNQVTNPLTNLKKVGK